MTFAPYKYAGQYWLEQRKKRIQSMHLSIEITFMDTQFFNSSSRSNNKTTHQIDRHHEIEMKKKDNMIAEHLLITK